MGLRMSYIQDENVRIFTKMLASLAFLPSQIVVNSFEQLDELREQSNLEILAPLYESFEDTYIGRPTRGGRGRRRAKFDLEMWNVRDRTTEGMPKQYESLNKRLVTIIGKQQGGEIEPLEFLRNVALNLELNV